jgi:uncharacterized protein (TIGR03067 family)
MVNRIGTALLALVIVTAGSLGAQAGTMVRSDSMQLQGSWTMVSGSAGGMALPPSYVGAMRRVLSGNDLTVTMSGELYFRATIVLDPATSPKTIDYRMTGGTTTGAIQHGIYAIAGDTIRFSFGAPSAARPADFTTAAGDGRTVSTWVRARP